MLNENAQLLVEDIESLLKDICDFLSENVSDGFTAKQKCLAEKLINRSKSQLQTIAKFTAATITEPDTSYVDMTPKVPIKEETKEVNMEEEYSAIDEQQVNRECPYKFKSALEIKEDNHWGYLERRKTLWLLAHQIRLFGVVKGGWLLLYNSEKENRPVEMLDLDVYEVKCLDANDAKCKKEARMFELVSATKNYQFLARNRKDLDQWITAISRTSKAVPDDILIEKPVEFKKSHNPKIMLKELPPLPQIPSIQNPYVMGSPDHKIKEPTDTYECYDVVSSDQDDKNEENIYECPIPINTLLVVQKEEIPPPLPSSLNANSKSFLHSPKKPTIPTEEDDEEVEYDLPLIEKTPLTLTQSQNNFTNLNFSNKLQENCDQQKGNNEPEEEYDEIIVTPKNTEVKAKIVKSPPPKIHPKPKFASINKGANFAKR